MAGKQTLTQLQPHRAFNATISRQSPVAGVIYNLPALKIPPGGTVILLGCVGLTPNNSALFVGLSQGAVASGNGATAIPSSSFSKDGLPIAVDDLSQIWWKANYNGDGITALINAPAVG